MTSYRVSFVRGDGEVVQDAPLDALLTLSLADLQPCRKVQNYRHQVNQTGEYWFTTQGVHLAFESRLEEAVMRQLDQDRGVRRVAAQPFLLTWTAEDGRVLGHYPDLLADRVGQRRLVLDVRPTAHTTDEDTQRAFQTTRQACSAIGWAYEVRSEPHPTHLFNLRWLGGHRRPPHALDEYAPALLDLARRTPRPLGELADAVGEPFFARPVLFYLLWKQDLTTDLNVPLSDMSVIHARV
ncbi:hypothetical protein DAERI_010054 [Deinococcus aerius]|uniref:TnsA endonuclease N-terminal domain-containing protein n=1 Tax=Deinococcus aerius TaxID=200253 RepID=A0A2I9CQY3_9DEIO|nr:TnsA-like heteromeric transposase endonuclease subunit [Deinococcus aerius]GBF03882.1 hypothetical protein DAERI_010054 [Deinococcus aerius]